MQEINFWNGSKHRREESHRVQRFENKGSETECCSRHSLMFDFLNSVKATREEIIFDGKVCSLLING